MQCKHCGTPLRERAFRVSAVVLLFALLGQAAGATGIQIQSLGKYSGVSMVEIPEGVSKAELLQLLQDHPGVEFAEEDGLLRGYSQPNDPDLPQQWAMYRLGLFTDGLAGGASDRGAWNRSTGSDGVVVCVIDSGIDWTHPDLAANVWTNKAEIPDNGIDDDNNGFIDDVHGYNFLTNTGDAMDNNFHGTHLAGMVGALCNNAIGVCGVNQRVKVMGCKFLDGSGNGYTSDAVRCLDYALRMGADITLNSYGGLYADSQALQATIAATEARGQLFVTAAGNDYGVNIDATPTYPAAYSNKNMMTVIATDQNDVLAGYSNVGANLTDVAAPGSKILSTILHGQYGVHEGTSQSAGYVAGAAALLLAAHRAAGLNATGAQMKGPIMRGAAPAPSLAGKCKSGGMLDIGRAMAFVPQRPEPAEAAAGPAAAAAPEQAPLAAAPAAVVAEAPSLNARPIRVSQPALVLGGYPGGNPTETLAAKSLAAPAAAAALWPADLPSAGSEEAGAAASVWQAYNGAFPLQHASLALTPRHGGGFAACTASGVRGFPNDPAYGRDITRQLLQGQGYSIALPEAVEVGGLAVAFVAVHANGSVSLLPAAEPAAGAPSAAGGQAEQRGGAGLPQIAALANAGLDLAAGGNVSAYLRPDRLVVTYQGVPAGPSAAQRLPCSFQVELFTAAGHYHAAGGVRLTWLEVGATSGAVGLSVGSGPAAGLDLAHQDACLEPARMAVSGGDALRAVTLPAAGQREGTPVTVPLRVANRGSAPLALALALRARSENVLVRQRWLDAAGGPAPSLSRSSSGCSADKGGSGACAEFAAGAGGGVALLGGDGLQPLRYAQALQLPLRAQAALRRTRPCSDHVLALSSRPTAPRPGEEGTVWVRTRCGRLLLDAPGQGNASGRSSSGAACVDFGASALELEVSGSAVAVRGDRCARLGAQHGLGAGPLYLWLGANCSQADCPGGVLWDSLELQSGPSTVLELPEAASSADSAAPRGGKILFMQQPAAAPGLESSLQGLLGGYPADALAPEPDQAAAAAEGPVALPVRLGLGARGGEPDQAAGGALLQGDERAVSAASLDAQLGRKLLGSGAAPAEEQVPVGAVAAGKLGGDARSVEGRLYGDGHASQDWRKGGKVGEAEDAALAAAPEEAAGLGEASQPGGGSPADAGRTPSSVVRWWVRVQQRSVTIPGHSEASQLLTFTGANVSAGHHLAELVFLSNDPDSPVTRLPVEMVSA